MTNVSQNGNDPIELVAMGEREPVEQRIDGLSPVHFVLELVGVDENDELDARITVSGFETPEQTDILKSMLHQIADTL
jgi:hypothetical protein